MADQKRRKVVNPAPLFSRNSRQVNGRDIARVQPKNLHFWQKYSGACKIKPAFTTDG